MCMASFARALVACLLPRDNDDNDPAAVAHRAPVCAICTRAPAVDIHLTCQHLVCAACAEKLPLRDDARTGACAYCARALLSQLV